MVEGQLIWNHKTNKIMADNKPPLYTIYSKLKFIAVFVQISLYICCYLVKHDEMLVIPIYVLYSLYLIVNSYCAYYLLFKPNLFQTAQNYINYLKNFLKTNQFKLGPQRTNRRNRLNTIFTDDISQLETLDYLIAKDSKLTKLNFDIDIIAADGVFKRLYKKFGILSFFQFSNYDFIYVVSTQCMGTLMKVLYLIAMLLTLCELYDIIIFNFISNRNFIIRRKVNENQITYLVPKVNDDFKQPDN
jgi:hypothetical protein